MLRRKRLQGLALFLILSLLSGILCGCGEKRTKEQAEQYVQANLDVIFQGESKEAEQMLNASEKEIEQIYESGVQAFVEQYLTGDVDSENKVTQIFVYMMKEIFRMMRYQVVDVKEEEKGIYLVTVDYAPVNVFENYIPNIQKEALAIEKKAEQGGYQGSQEEIQEAMMTDYLNHAAELLEVAYLEMEYGEEEQFQFHVSVENKKEWTTEKGEINTFIEQILKLDKL